MPMKSATRWTPLLRDDPEGPRGATYFDDALCPGVALPRHSAGDAHPLSLPRVKQRARRATVASNAPRRRGSSTMDGGSGSKSTSESEIGVTRGVGNDGSLAKPELGRKATDDDPLTGGSAAGARRPFFDGDDRDVKIAAAGLSDDPLSLLMEEQAVATNMYRHMGELIDKDGGDLVSAYRSNGSPPAADSGRGIKAGSPRGELERRASVSAVTAGLGTSDKTSGVEQRKEGAAWGKRWEAHLEGMLKQWGGGDGESDPKGRSNSGPDQAAGPSKISAAPMPPRSKSRYETRLGELETVLSGGSGGSGVGGGGSKARNVAGVPMAGSLLLTPEDYTAHVAELNNELREAWSKEEKVTALKVTVQASKLLGNILMPTSYPALFSMVAALLDAFGAMVFERILARAEDPLDGVATGASSASTSSQQKQAPTGDTDEAKGGAAPARTPSRHALPESWTCEDIGPDARETCRNWFYKTACIRELLPRILVEAALLPCYRFLAAEEEFGRILGRLATLVRGVGDPMVAVFCGCFVAAAGAKVAPRETAHAVGSLQDYLFSLQEVQVQQQGKGKLAGYLRANGMGVSDYLRLHTPAVEWLLDIVSPGAPRTVFTTILKYYRNHCGSLEILRLVLERFGPEHYSPFALEMALLIKQGRAGSSPCTTAEVMGLLGRRLRANPPSGPDAVPLLNEAWQEIAPAPLEVYVDGAAAWLSVLLRGPSYSPDEVSILAADVATRIEGATQSALRKVQGQLSKGIVETLAAAEDLEALQAAGGHLVKILGALDKGRRAQACLELLRSSLRALPRSSTAADTANAAATADVDEQSDGREPEDAEGGATTTRGYKGARRATELARVLVGVAKMLHDSLDLLAGWERQRQSAAELTCDLVERVGRGWARGLEGPSGRSAADDGAGTDESSRLAILAECRQAFWSMDEVTDRLVLAAVGLAVKAWQKGANATARAGLCFCSLTIPSVPSALRRLALLQLCANAALRVGKPALADALFRSAICVVPECSTLVVSGADPGAAVASTFAASPSDFMSPNPDGGEPSGASAQGGAVDDPFRRNSAYLAAGGYGRSVGGGGVASVGSCGVGARKEHAGAWLLTESVKSLLAALVAVPGHPDLGPLYLFRGLIKAIRRLPWPTGSGLLASLYITAAGTLCAMWQKRLPYSIKTPAATATASCSADGDGNTPPAFVEGDGHEGGDEEPLGTQSSAPVSTLADASCGPDGDADGATGAVAPAAKAAAPHLDEVERGVEAGDGNGGGVVDADGGAKDTNGAGEGATAGDAPDGGRGVENAGGDGGGGGNAVGFEDSEGGEVGEAQGAEEGAGPPSKGPEEEEEQQQQEQKEEKRSWLDVGGVLGNDDLYLRTSPYLEEVHGLLGELIMATLKELEELWEQGDEELSSIVGSDHTRTARIRYARLTLDLANRLVSSFRMEGGAATVVIFLVEASARAGARGGVRGGSSAAYFKDTVESVARVAQAGLDRARDAQRRAGGSSEAEDREDACLTLLQGLSGFTRSSH